MLHVVGFSWVDAISYNRIPKNVHSAFLQTQMDKQW